MKETIENNIKIAKFMGWVVKEEEPYLVDTIKGKVLDYLLTYQQTMRRAILTGIASNQYFSMIYPMKITERRLRLRKEKLGKSYVPLNMAELASILLIGTKSWK